MFRFAKGAGQRVQERLVRKFDHHQKPASGGAAAFVHGVKVPFSGRVSSSISFSAELGNCARPGRVQPLVNWDRFRSTRVISAGLRSGDISAAVLVNARRQCYQILGHAVIQFAR